MKKIIVTGCNGQLGRAVNLFFKDNKDISFVNTDVGELDITNIDKVMELAREVQPYAIINCAAHTGVSLLFGGNPESAFVQVVLIDVVAEQQHVVGAVLIQVDRFSLIAEAGGRFVVNDCERLFLSGRRIEDEYSL